MIYFNMCINYHYISIETIIYKNIYGKFSIKFDFFTLIKLEFLKLKVDLFKIKLEFLKIKLDFFKLNLAVDIFKYNLTVDFF